VRRSRSRFWKNEADADKAAAYQTLWEVLTTLTALLAPSMPFLAETMYQNLVRRADADAPVSVHHREWPVADPERDDPDLRPRGFQAVWEVLTPLPGVLGASMAFLGEAMYQDLVRRADAGAPVSGHHREWPVADPERDDPDLRAAMGLVRLIVGLGRAARNHK